MKVRGCFGDKMDSVLLNRERWRAACKVEVACYGITPSPYLFPGSKR